MYRVSAKNTTEKFCQVLMQARAAKEEPFVNLDWAPRILKDYYPPAHLEGKGAGASPIVLMFRNGKLRSGHAGPWCIGSATWLLVQQGPVIGWHRLGPCPSGFQRSGCNDARPSGQNAVAVARFGLGKSCEVSSLCHDRITLMGAAGHRPRIAWHKHSRP